MTAGQASPSKKGAGDGRGRSNRLPAAPNSGREADPRPFWEAGFCRGGRPVGIRRRLWPGEASPQNFLTAGAFVGGAPEICGRGRRGAGASLRDLDDSGGLPARFRVRAASAIGGLALFRRHGEGAALVSPCQD